MKCEEAKRLKHLEDGNRMDFSSRRMASGLVSSVSTVGKRGTESACNKFAQATDRDERNRCHLRRPEDPNEICCWDCV
jgi:hypothetical protein